MKVESHLEESGWCKLVHFSDANWYRADAIRFIPYFLAI